MEELKKTKTHLVIGDAHAEPQTSNARFDWLANFIEDKKPNVIIDIGDWGDMNSIGHYVKGKKDAWGVTIQDDVAAFRDASKRAFGGLKNIKGYNPRLYRFGGNHEEGRLIKLINDNPELEGLISLTSLGVRDYGANYTPFRQIKVIDGIAYSHYFYDKDSRYPIMNARTVLQRKFMSCVYGHGHIRDMAEGVNGVGKRIIALQAGCYLDSKQKMNYAGPQGNDRWWKGLCLLTEVNQGEFNPHFYGIERIQHEYA